MAQPPVTAHLFVDYQNLHLSAHETFAAFQAPIHHSLIHPGKFADAVEAQRNRLVYQQVKIVEIHVYRGQPSNENDAIAAARNKAQAAEWTRDPRVKMHTRGLKYPRDGSAPREKGVDVMLAIDLVRCSIAKAADVLILASRDTDLLPALEAAYDLDGAIVETSTWKGQSRLRFSTGRRPLWCTALDEPGYQASKDPKTY